jgi:multidrug resistance efflux pump
MLATKAPGKITYLAKKTWDRIYKWELIASLDWAEAKTGYSTASSIISSLQDLKNATIESFEEQIKAMEAKIEQAKTWLKWLETWLTDTQKITDSQIKTAKIWLETAKTNLEETKKSLESKKSNILAWAKTAITQNVILSENILDFIDTYLWVTPENENKNDAYEDYIWVKNKGLLRETITSFIKTKETYDNYKKYFEEYIENKNPNEKQLIEWLNIAEKTSEQLKDLLDLTYDTLDNSLENINFPLTMINQYKAQISKFGSDLEKSLLSMSWDTMIWVKWTLENLKSFESESKKAISLLEKQVEIAKQQLAQYENMASWQINEVSTKKEVAIKQLQEAQAWLEALKAWKQAKLKELDSKISEALWQKNLSAVYINNGKVYSPINWIIVSKNAEVSQVIWAWMPIYTVASDNNVKVKISIPNFVAKWINLWDKVQVSIENNNKTYTWTIVQLPDISNMITKKINAEILINNKNKDIHIWSMANVRFKIKNILENNNNWTVVIPNEAIIEKYMLPWVYIVKNWKAQFTQIEIISTDSQYSQVKWIEPNSQIITDWKENIFDWEELN